jgi:DNA-binding NarL/FixJ family response regulator
MLWPESSRHLARRSGVPSATIYAAYQVALAKKAREEPAPRVDGKPNLTLRQMQLVTLVAQGLTNKEIASQLNLSEFTVKNHLYRIMKQVDAGTRYEAVETVRAQLDEV